MRRIFITAIIAVTFGGAPFISFAQEGFFSWFAEAFLRQTANNTGNQKAGVAQDVAAGTAGHEKCKALKGRPFGTTGLCYISADCDIGECTTKNNIPAGAIEDQGIYAQAPQPANMARPTAPALAPAGRTPCMTGATQNSPLPKKSGAASVACECIKKSDAYNANVECRKQADDAYQTKQKSLTDRVTNYLKSVMDPNDFPKSLLANPEQMSGYLGYHCVNDRQWCLNNLSDYGIKKGSAAEAKLINLLALYDSKFLVKQQQLNTDHETDQKQCDTDYPYTDYCAVDGWKPFDCRGMVE